ANAAAISESSTTRAKPTVDAQTVAFRSQSENSDNPGKAMMRRCLSTDLNLVALPSYTGILMHRIAQTEMRFSTHFLRKTEVNFPAHAALSQRMAAVGAPEYKRLKNMEFRRSKGHGSQFTPDVHHPASLSSACGMQSSD